MWHLAWCKPVDTCCQANDSMWLRLHAWPARQMVHCSMTWPSGAGDGEWQLPWCALVVVFGSNLMHGQSGW